MKRLTLALAIVIAASLTPTGCSTTANTPKVIRIGHIQNTDHPHHLALVKFAEIVKQQSGGKLEVQVFPNSQLGNALTQIQSVKTGGEEGFLDGVGWYGQLCGEYYVFGTAFALKDWNQCVRVMNGPIGQEMADKLLKTQGLKVINQAWYRLPRQLLTRKPVRTVADLSGVKIRVPEIASYLAAWKALGASPTPVAFSEVYLALQKGVIDMIYTSKLYEGAKYLSITNHQYEPGSLVMNDKFFESLTPREQGIIISAANEAQAYNNQLTAANEKEILKKLEVEGVTVITVDRNQFAAKAKNVPARLEEEGMWRKGLFKEIEQTNN
jgi:tripartite ATP-independent transporter DctP family solute receptor